MNDKVRFVFVVCVSYLANKQLGTELHIDGTWMTWPVGILIGYSIASLML
jgi:hypothetical protein